MSAVNDDADINVSFDIGQVSSDLLWHALDDQSKRNLCSRFGRYASAVHLREGDGVNINVTAYGRVEDKFTIQVKDAVLCTIPITTSVNKFFAPSPFSKERATIAVQNWERTRPVVVDGKHSRVVQSTLTPLAVIHKEGRWKLSLIITVSIERTVGKEKTEEIRVFSFDPEAEIGSGTEPTECPPTPYMP
ncbi:hypothetical protein XcmpCFBP7700_02840 [Xanthomonas campestris]|uniref:hypothetical protein n=1 Tax=Xanthomonas campestris TaxID=339 RepID=UPI000E770CC4|nr:hypothetical protein [Xanthomonas campestris]RJU10274.1 hypothetical protein XcmpCFBP7700_02840 [Xanthomonas campestris]